MVNQAKHVDKKLTRGPDSMILGVCSGVGEYLGVDATVIRLLWVIVTVITGFSPGVVGYLIAAFIIPAHP
jgi:phage shock protein C